MRITQRTRLKSIVFLLMLFSFSVSAGGVSAETRYVSDQLIITLREGRGNEYKIIKTLKTGTHLEVIEDSGDHLKVRTDSGLEGWVLKQYVTGEIPKSEVIAGLEKKVERMNTEIAQYKKDKELLQGQLNSARSEHEKRIMDLRQNVSAREGLAEETARELKDITGKYNALSRDSKNVVQIVNERDSLQSINNRLQSETEQLQKENEGLRRAQMIWWFAAGGGVFFVGWITGKMSRQKRYY